MARTNDTALFEKILLQFVGEAEPVLSMLEWTAQRLMEIEAQGKAGAAREITERSVNLTEIPVEISREIANIYGHDHFISSHFLCMTNSNQESH
jgi:hypothetical protein